MPIAASAIALTTTNNVKLFMGRADEDPTQDDQIQLFINNASRTIIRECDREFKSDLGTGTRSFATPKDFPGYGYVTFNQFCVQSNSITLVQIDTDTTNPTTIDPTQYQLHPINNLWGVATGIRFYTYAVGSILRQGAGMRRQVSVTGTWGFTSVPEDVEHACILTVVSWLRRDAQGYSQRADIEEPKTGKSRAIPPPAWDLLAPYFRIPVG